MTARGPVAVTFTTDFGLADWYAGAMRGAVLARAPHATLVDITHDVPPFDVEAGAFHLAAACRAFPSGTVHLAVVDPGVGGPRRPIALLAGGHFLVGPDNGVLSRAAHALAGAARGTAGVVVDPARLAPVPPSATFHGRDLFAPAAAALAMGAELSALGEAYDDWVTLPDIEPAPAGPGAVDATVLHVDRFGNAITNLDGVRYPAHMLWADLGGRIVRGALSYCAVRPGEPLLVAGGSGYIEIAVREARADSMFGLARGARIEIRIGHQPPMG